MLSNAQAKASYDQSINNFQASVPDAPKGERTGVYEELLKKRDAQREARADKREKLDLDEELQKLERIKLERQRAWDDAVEKKQKERMEMLTKLYF